MRRWIYVLPLALAAVGPVASARAQGCSGVVCRKYARTEAVGTSPTGAPAVAPGEWALDSNSVTMVAQPGMVANGQGYGGATPVMMTNSSAQADGGPAMPEQRGHLFGRWFRGRSEQAVSTVPVARGEQPVVLGGRPVPSDPAVVPVGLTMNSAATDSGSVPVDFPIQPEFQARAGHDANYTSVTGQAYHLQGEGGLWVVRFAPMESGDRYGGLVLLDPSSQIKGLHEGDLVAVHGHLCPEKKGSMMINAPVYQPERISVLQGEAR